MPEGLNIRFFVGEHGREQVEIAPVYNPGTIVIRESTLDQRLRWPHEHAQFKRSLRREMTTEVKQVTSVLKDELPKLKEAADQLTAKAKASIANATNVLHAVDAQFTDLDTATAELQATLGMSTNSPPTSGQ